ncbi:chloroplast photosystem II protein PsbX [Chloropicon primus]|uniref:Chloroplast photosystem II protein PsbX n=1 Tax=Chloropicon primus TaxID=1764295 RepID=A0A5B8MDQ6_9CHLO|nr:chloroplast photosystem II protein PsbX [Chloropicon primus]UPQ97726.1 chloroplast photosystem II protein PsbX [Chloropicon primus]|eukprot:QDZ18517.1 chloroplast photosystem II protein PsbX [Chloropicon primus]
MNAAVVRMNCRATGAGARTTAAALPARRTVAQRGVRATRKATVMSSKISQTEKLQAAFLVSSAAALGSPLIPAAEAATVSPSLRNLLRSVVAGGFILAAIAGALSTISRFDRTERR